MNYVILKDDYLAHHGVKGMKWGVRKQNYTTRRGKNKQKLYFDYYKKNKYGEMQRKSTRIGSRTMRGLQKKGLVDNRGMTTEGNRANALSYVRKMKAAKASIFVGAAAVAAGAAAVAAYGSQKVTRITPEHFTFDPAKGTVRIPESREYLRRYQTWGH